MPSTSPSSPGRRARTRLGVLSILLTFLLAALGALSFTGAIAGAGRTGGGGETRLAPADAEARGRVAEAYGRLPLSFEANRGQFDGDVRFSARGIGYGLFLTPTEAVFALRGKHAREARDGYRVLRMRLLGADASPRVEGSEELPGKLNYFVGPDPAGWRTDVPLYSRAHFRGVYPGVDLVYYGRQGELEYDFELAPGADPRAIKLEFSGAERLKVEESGDLLLEVGGGELRMRRPVVYQPAQGGGRQPVEGRYKVRGRTASFEVGAYDESRPLVIDPILSYSTYIGGPGTDAGYAIAVDSAGSAYVAGETSSLNFPTTGQTFTTVDNFLGHAFVTKLNPSGTALAYSTLIGGSSAEAATGIALDAAGNAYLTGRTNSTNFPLVNPFRGSANLVKSTDAGGNWAASNAGLGTLTISALALDPTNASVVYAGTFGAGVYKSTDAGATWAKLLTGFSSVYALAVDPQHPSTLYAAVNESIFGVYKSTDGGATWAQARTGLNGGGINSLAVDPQNPSTLYAGTNGGVFKTTNGGANWAPANTGLNFVGVTSFAFDPTNTQTIYAATPGGGVFKTTNGGANWVQMNTGLADTFARSLAVDPVNPSVVYVGTFGGGVFKSTNGAGEWSPVNTGLTNTAVHVLALDPGSPSTLYAGTTRTGIFKTADGGGSWAPVYGGLSVPRVIALVVGPSGTVYAGIDLVSNGFGDDREAFVTKLNPAGNALVYSTYLGGEDDDEGAAIAVDSAGRAHVVGTTASADFPVANPRQSTLNSQLDAFVTKLDAAGNALVYSTYLGGTGHDNARGVAVDSSGNAYVAGDTISADFPVTPGAFQTSPGNQPNFGTDDDAFVTKLDPSGSSFLYSTYLGGSGGDRAYAVAVDSAGSAYVAGTTGSANFPLNNPAQPAFGGGSFFGDAFLTKLNPSGSALVYSTYVGGTRSDHARGVAVAPDGSAVIAGSTESNDFPITVDSFTSKSGLFRSLDGGASWDNRGAGLTGGLTYVAADPSNPLVLYAVGEKGVFKTADGGRTWALRTQGLPCCIEEVAVDAKNPSVVYAVGISGAGLYKTTDGGNTWAAPNANGNFFQARAVAVDPTSSNVVYVGYAGGIFKSTDGGASGATNNTTGAVNTITVDPSNGSNVFVTAGPLGRVFKSSNGGASYAPSDGGIPSNVSISRVAVSPANSSLVFAATSSGVYKSTDGGASWAVSLGQGWGSDVAFDPQNPSTLYASFQSGVNAPFVYKSTDAGATWKPTAGPAFRVFGLAVTKTSAVFAFSDSGGGGTDAFVTRLSPSGNAFIYSTYLGGQAGQAGVEPSEIAYGVAADAAGNAYVAGYTTASDFPTTPGAYQTTSRSSGEAFVTKLEESFAISGTVTSGGTPQAGVRITLSGDGLRAVTTGADGFYLISNLRRGGNYTVSASKAGFTFAPPAHAFNNLTANQTADFTAAASTVPFHTIGGHVAEANGFAVAGVTVVLGGSQIEFTTTDASGNYSFTAPQGGDYTVTPQPTAGFVFEPPGRSINGLVSNQTADFTAVRQTLVVTNTNDAGSGSLRQAILNANDTPGADRITFNIPGAGARTVRPLSPLPELTGPVVIDGTTQPGYAGSPLVQIEGSLVSLNTITGGLRLSGGDSSVRALAVNNWRSGSGITLGGDGNLVEGCFVGVDANGSAVRPNQSGIHVAGTNNLVGGTTPSARNVISGNSFYGVLITGANNRVQGNYIGTNAAGDAAMGNGSRGVEAPGTTDPTPRGLVIGGTEPGARNVISGNLNGGVAVSATGTRVQGNYIGTNAAGTAPIPNTFGVRVEGRNVLVGGTDPAARNVISGNGTGVIVSTFTNDHASLVQGNYIGTDAAGAAAVPNQTGVEVNSPNTLIGGTAPGAGNVISGNRNSGIHCLLGGSTLIQGNLIGTDATGARAVGNQAGVSLSSINNVVGGTEPGARNVISGNSFGVQIGSLISSTPTGNTVLGNYIGTNAAGDAPVPNTTLGVGLTPGANTRVGGDEQGAGNLIAFNGVGVGVSFTNGLGNTVRGNRIFSNVGLGIDLDWTSNSASVVTPNDAGDADTGPNRLQNFPLLTSVASAAGGTAVRGTLDSTPGTQFRIDFYTNAACDPSGHGEGARPFGSTQVTTDSSGRAAFDFNAPDQLPAGRVLTATATDPEGNTSEFSTCDASAAAGSVEFAASDLRVLEDVGSAVVRVLRVGGSRGPLAINFAAAGGTATPGADYTPVSGTLNFADGETEKTFLVPVAADPETEPDETVQLTLSGAAELDSFGQRPRAVLHILDANTTVNVFGENMQVAEGNTGRRNVSLPIRLSAATGRTVTVNYSTLPGTATPGLDFIPTSGTLTFAPGTDTQFVTAQVVGDTLDEANESFVLALTNPTNAQATQGANVSIVDDDPLPSVSVTDLSVVESASGATAVFAIRLSAPSARTVSVNYATSNGTAASGADYTDRQGGVNFVPGQTVRFVEVPLLSDGAAEPDETFFLNLFSPVNALIADTQGVATIIDASSSATLLQFGASVYAADEAGGPVTVTVNRTGDTSKAAEVTYRTVSQSASERTDFTAAFGTLSFAPGEASKSFDVLVNDDAYAEPTEALDLVLSNPVGASLGGPNVAVLTIGSDDAADGPSLVNDPFSNTQFFVRQHYHDFFSREPDAPGLAHWTNVIESCGSDAQCREVNRINTSGAFFLSIEFTDTGYLIERIYKAAYGDAVGTSTLNGPHQLPVPIIRLEEFLPDTQRIGRGVVVLAPGWEAQLEANKVAFTREFVQRTRFLNDFPLTMTPTEFVDQLNARAGNPLDTNERQALIDELTADNTTAGRASVLRKVAEDATLADAEKNRAFVLMQYFGYLRRNPNGGQDTDYTGYDFWLGNLEKAGGNFVQAELVKAFIQSIEYRERFGQP